MNCLDSTIPVPSTKTNVINSLFQELSKHDKINETVTSSSTTTTTRRINHFSEIPFSKRFQPSSFESRTYAHIQKFSKFFTVVETTMDDNIQLTIIFIWEKLPKLKKIIAEKVSQIQRLYLFLKPFMKREFSQSFTVFLYMTSLLKLLPKKLNHPLGYYEINTGFTIINHNEIVVFREEEWFKVLIHESFHALGLDFGATNTEDMETKILQQTFHVKTEILLSEAYAEFWANLLNVYFVSKDAKAFQQKLKKEKQFKVFQMVKVLNYMEMKYIEFFTNPHNDFKEATNVFSYYVLGCILIYFCEDFVEFCLQKNDSSILQSKLTIEYIHAVCEFIRLRCKNAQFLRSVRVAEGKLRTLKKKRNSKQKFTLRMTCH